MRLIEHRNKRAYLREDDYKILLERFNPENMRYKEPHSFEIKIECPLCKRYSNGKMISLKNCKNCPLITTYGGCRKLLRYLVEWSVIYYQKEILTWEMDMDFDAVEEINTIRNWLLKLPYVAKKIIKENL